MFTLLHPNEIDLRTGWSQRPKIVTPDPEKENFGHITEIEADSSSIRATILPHFFPNDISLILKSPRFHNGQTIRQALNASKYSFTTDASTGFISAIEGVIGNYIYGSTPSDVSIDSAANTVTHFRFSEAMNSTPSSGLQTLMQVMADYLEEDSDVQNAAAKEYQTALDGYQ